MRAVLVEGSSEKGLVKVVNCSGFAVTLQWVVNEWGWRVSPAYKIRRNRMGQREWAEMVQACNTISREIEFEIKAGGSALDGAEFGILLVNGC